MLKFGRLTKPDIMTLIEQAKVLFTAEPTIQRFSGNKITVCGDVHGQFSDMERIFALNGPPTAANPYLFNGDFVDRGPNSLGCLMTLLTYKLASPNSVLLNRGNHEFPEMNAYYGFRKELGDDEVWRAFNELFQTLPVAAVLNERVFVVHGGLARKCHLVSELERRTKNDPIFHEYFWNDPAELPGVSPNPRGEDVFRFGPDVTQKFLASNSLSLLIRSHEMVDPGFEYSQEGQCLTVFSAPNYAGHFANKGAYAIVKGREVECTAFGGKTNLSSKL